MKRLTYFHRRRVIILIWWVYQHDCVVKIFLSPATKCSFRFLTNWRQEIGSNVNMTGNCQKNLKLHWSHHNWINCHISLKKYPFISTHMKHIPNACDVDSSHQRESYQSSTYSEYESNYISYLSNFFKHQEILMQIKLSEELWFIGGRD